MVDHNGRIAREALEKLRSELRGKLDDSVILPLAAEVDLTDPTKFNDLLESLRAIAADKDVEEAKRSNMSGVAGFDDVVDGNRSVETPADASIHNGTDLLVSQVLQSSQPRPDAQIIQNSSLASLSLLDSKPTPDPPNSEGQLLAQLRAMFLNLKDHDIKLALKTANGDFERAVDGLLIIQMLEDEGGRLKGIDTFFRPDEDIGKTGKGRKGSNKKGGQPTPLAREESTSSVENPYMKDYEASLQLTQLLNCDFEVAKQAYYSSGKSIGAAVAAYLERNIETNPHNIKITESEAVRDLAARHQNIPHKLISAIVDITGDAVEVANQLADLLNKHYAKGPRQKLAIDYTLAPPKDELEGYTTAPKARRGQLSSDAPQRALPISSVADPQAALSCATVRYQTSLASLADTARRGRSDPFFRQASTVYAERSQDARRDIHAATSALADLRVAETATASSIDLHGLPVDDGVRVALEGVRRWWDGLAASEEGGRARQPWEEKGSFVVITGRGKHNPDGFSRMRQVVLRRLREEGWKVEVETGSFRVVGRV